MSATEFPVRPPQDEAPATPASVREDLLGDQVRRGPAIRTSFIQEWGGKRTPGPLHLFVKERRLFALHLYLLLHCIARKAPWDATLPASTWALALDKPNSGGEAAVSRSWAWLVKKKLVRTDRKFRKVQAFLRREDASDKKYTQSNRFFYFPLAFFREGWHLRLGLPGTAVLLIALMKSSKDPWFELRTEKESEWYGISPDTLQRGLDELRDAGLLFIHPRKVRDVKARFATTVVNVYMLKEPFATPLKEPAVDQGAA